jgi:hypothetical protein
MQCPDAPKPNLPTVSPRSKAFSNNVTAKALAIIIS